jgi:hypothetical protein
MNSRIKELAKQAGYGQTDDPYVRQAFDVNMFAELIILECASICEINGQSYKHSFTPSKARLAESTSNHCAMMIKQHFGIENDL